MTGWEYEMERITGKAHGTSTAGLKSDVIGLIGAVTFGVVMLSPAMTIYGGFGPSFLLAGNAAPLAFILALVATLPTAISYALLARSHPDAGSAASWIARFCPAGIARWAGWIVFLYYFTNFTIQPVTLGVFLSDLLVTMGLPASPEYYFLGALLCCLWPAWMVYRGIALSEKGALGFLVFETVVVVALCLTVLLFASSRGALHVSTVDVAGAGPSGSLVTGVFRAMVFGMLAFCGFDVISTLAEEAKAPRTLIPQATFLALVLFGVLIIAGIWILTFASSPEHLREVADSGAMPISEIARIYWGKAAVFVPVTAISAALGLAIATSVGASRIALAMGRSGNAPSWLAWLHPGHRVPWKALHLVFGAGLAAAVFTGLVLGPYQAWVWWGTTSTFFAMNTYMMVNVANLVLFRKSAAGSLAGFFLHGVIPVTGIMVDAYILVRSFFIELWNQGWATGRSVILVDVALALAAMLFALKRHDVKDA
mgnify:CR=1 FL=1